ncbi:MAG: hypothetical protein CMJ64_24910 [Planctomycetaceae bacterium]|nr:hypothetical protein [Planctomycetaceae bacterium]
MVNTSFTSLTDIEKQFVSIVPSTLNQNVRQRLQNTFDDFRSGCTEWESEVTEFFGDLDDFLESKPQARASAPAGSSRIADDVVGLRSLVERQTDVLAALVNALAGESPTPSAVSPPTEDTDQVVEAFFDRVEQLQQATVGGDLP